jgi:signal transduction histidine kinase
MSVVAVQAAPASFLATVAHELRNPVCALETSSELLSRDFELLSSTEVRAMVAAIHRRAIWLHDLVENLLCAATARDGQLRMQKRPFDLRELLDEARPILEPLLARKDQRLRIATGHVVPIVAADARRLGQALVNLVTNASKYSPAGTTIDLSIRLRKGWVRASVADRGQGIEKDRLAGLFEPYNRAGRTDGDGVGIGLSIVKLIVDAHEGRLGVVSRRGGGTTFWFELAPLVGAGSQLSGTYHGADQAQ